MVRKIIRIIIIFIDPSIVHSKTDFRHQNLSFSMGSLSVEFSSVSPWLVKTLFTPFIHISLYLPFLRIPFVSHSKILHCSLLYDVLFSCRIYLTTPLQQLLTHFSLPPYLLEWCHFKYFFCILQDLLHTPISIASSFLAYFAFNVYIYAP